MRIFALPLRKPDRPGMIFAITLSSCLPLRKTAIWTKIKEYLSCASSKIPSQDLHFCENQAADGVLGYYSALAKRESIPFHAKTDLPSHIAVDEIDMCLVLSNLLENAIQASQKTEVPAGKLTWRFIFTTIICF